MSNASNASTNERFHCYGCGDDVDLEAMELFGDTWRHESEGNYEGERWRQEWCGPVEHLATCECDDCRDESSASVSK